MDVLLAERRGRTQILTLNRPRRRNALDTELLRALEAGFAAAEADGEVDVIVLTGTDPAFCGGVDLRELEERGRAPEMGAPLEGVGKPVIGAVNGPAITGGLELALMCDLLVASEQAGFGDTHGRVGLLPGWGQMARLPAAVGGRRAAELLLSSRIVGAEEALAIGLANEVVDEGNHVSRALEIAEALASFPQPTMLSDRAAAIDGAGLSLDDGLALEDRLGRQSVITGVLGAARFAEGEGRGGQGAGA